MARSGSEDSGTGSAAGTAPATGRPWRSAGENRSAGAPRHRRRVERRVAARLRDPGRVGHQGRPANPRTAGGARGPRCPARAAAPDTRTGRHRVDGDRRLVGIAGRRRRGGAGREPEAAVVLAPAGRAGQRRAPSGADAPRGSPPVLGPPLELGQPVERLERRQRVHVDQPQLLDHRIGAAGARRTARAGPGSRAASGGGPGTIRCSPSSVPRISRARRTTSSGSPASWATWMP